MTSAAATNRDTTRIKQPNFFCQTIPRLQPEINVHQMTCHKFSVNCYVLNADTPIGRYTMSYTDKEDLLLYVPGLSVNDLWSSFDCHCWNPRICCCWSRIRRQRRSIWNICNWRCWSCAICPCNEISHSSVVLWLRTLPAVRTVISIAIVAIASYCNMQKQERLLRFQFCLS